MMWQRVSDMINQQGGTVRLGTEVAKILWEKNRVVAIEVRRNGQKELITGSHFISSMPIMELIQNFEPAVPDQVRKAAMDLNYRDFLTVVLIINKPDVFPDNWIYIHDPDVKVGRIQNFKNWSPYMVPDHNKTCLGLEYFCFKGDGMWTMADEQLIELGKRELDILGLVRASEVEDGTVVRMPKAYPVYDGGYEANLACIRNYLATIPNLQLIGRNGQHRYNNQDHSMLTAMVAVDNIAAGRSDKDSVWNVNTEQEYHEEK